MVLALGRRVSYAMALPSLPACLGAFAPAADRSETKAVAAISERCRLICGTPVAILLRPSYSYGGLRSTLSLRIALPSRQSGNQKLCGPSLFRLQFCERTCFVNLILARSNSQFSCRRRVSHSREKMQINQLMASTLLCLEYWFNCVDQWL